MASGFVGNVAGQHRFGRIHPHPGDAAASSGESSVTRRPRGRRQAFARGQRLPAPAPRDRWSRTAAPLRVRACADQGQGASPNPGWDRNNRGNSGGRRRGEELPKEDRAPSPSEESPYELTLAQQLMLQQYINEIEKMSAEQCQELAVEIMTQMTVKENLIKEMLGKEEIPSPPPMPPPGEEPDDSDDR